MLTDAIVIKKTPIREHDQLVTLYTRELGKTTAVARSSLKASSTQALALDAGNRIRCELVPGKGMAIITGAQAGACLSSAKSSSIRWAAAQFFLQVIDALVYDHQQDDELFACLVQTLGAIDAATDEQVLAVFRHQQGMLLNVLGYGDVQASERSGRSELDDTYERIAQRRLATLDLFYELAGTRFS